MAQPSPPPAQANHPANLPPAQEPNDRFQFSLRALFVFIVVLAVLCSVADLYKTLPSPWGTVVGGVYFIALALVSFMFIMVTVHVIIVTVHGVLSGVLHRPHDRPHDWPSPKRWLQVTALAALAIMPIVISGAQEHRKRQLPNGYRVVSEANRDVMSITNPQGREIVSGRHITWQEQGEIVTGEIGHATYFALDTATGDHLVSRSAEEIRQFVERNKNPFN